MITHIKKIGKPVDKQSISYYSDIDKMDVFVGNDPIPEHESILITDLGEASPLKLFLKIKPAKVSSDSNIQSNIVIPS